MAGSIIPSMSGVGSWLDAGLGLALPLDNGIERDDLSASRLSARLRPWRNPVRFSEAKDMALAVRGIGGCDCCSRGLRVTVPSVSFKGTLQVVVEPSIGVETDCRGAVECAAK